mmetsp:Transcript_2055/g.6092  ORF Transcript_2055/g.6092 Transcript_2055/m.6092 type:complete len:677 (+) Transcript_2055:246-2276(+)|eukprot:CAMPEP_0117662252 /NCGR_PEP_ID=MMETSP0804-20121206/7956_1 /TAXON_ID=1074897 /ORGANISM="Tetraselmis astigmatica, Strain CCMP880" /LENGTH=676 /DNA_ID=CAMNT_0005469143 /DNA_START=184 /DNA_END=2214 /DNA_ORIENTATION=+
MGCCTSSPSVTKEEVTAHPVPAPSTAPTPLTTPIMTPQAMPTTPAANGGGTTPDGQLTPAEGATTPSGMLTPTPGAKTATDLGVTPTGVMSPFSGVHTPTDGATTPNGVIAMHISPSKAPSKTRAMPIFWDRTLSMGPMPTEIYEFLERNELPGLGVMMLMCVKPEVMPVRATVGDVQRTERDIQQTDCGKPLTTKLLAVSICALRAMQLLTEPQLRELNRQLTELHLNVRNVRELCKVLAKAGWIARYATGKVTPEMCKEAHANVVKAINALGLPPEGLAMLDLSLEEWESDEQAAAVHLEQDLDEKPAVATKGGDTAEKIAGLKEADYVADMEPLHAYLLAAGAGSLLTGCVALWASKDDQAKLAEQLSVPVEGIHSGLMHPAIEREQLRLEKEATVEERSLQAEELGVEAALTQSPHRVGSTTAQLMSGCVLESDGEEVAAAGTDSDAKVPKAAEAAETTNHQADPVASQLPRSADSNPAAANASVIPVLSNEQNKGEQEGGEDIVERRGGTAVTEAVRLLAMKDSTGVKELSNISLGQSSTDQAMIKEYTGPAEPLQGPHGLSIISVEEESQGRSLVGRKSFYEHQEWHETESHNEEQFAHPAALQERSSSLPAEQTEVATLVLVAESLQSGRMIRPPKPSNLPTNLMAKRRASLHSHPIELSDFSDDDVEW